MWKILADGVDQSRFQKKSLKIDLVSKQSAQLLPEYILSSLTNFRRNN